ncbi:GSCFA domain-containing protein [Sphingomonas sp. R86521]|uniref:GSCFA domain-containing protein n=1 Tax=Sphingomonas sp. R86521 TaxID=3093860 RepID=UPI0036D2EA5E
MASHPYKALPKQAFWRASVAEPVPGAVDPVGPVKFVLSRTDKVATAGSCFAQHIARHLSQSGFNYLVTEQAHPLLSKPIADKFGYGLFTARYANIYTSRQMIQLLQRAYGMFVPTEDIWPGPEGALIDPFRPQIQPGGFPTREEYDADREQHFAAIRLAIETLDCLVFTLGLTECWLSREDGAAYPLCPGVSGGSYDDDRYMFYNLTVSDVLADLQAIHQFVTERNPTARIILTVSPVPLAASASGEHVLTATTYSKSVLRAAAGEFALGRTDVAYFPSYEIITGSFNQGAYFEPDLRSVTEEGVSHVMRLFLAHYTSADNDTETKTPEPTVAKSRPRTTQELVAVVCEEEILQEFG